MISEILHSGLADYNELLKWSDLYNLRERFVEKTMKSLNAGKEGGAA